MKYRAPNWATVVFDPKVHADQGLYIVIPLDVKLSLEASARRQGLGFQDYMMKNIREFAARDHRP
jgi:hypothetical protein